MRRIFSVFVLFSFLMLAVPLTWAQGASDQASGGLEDLDALLSEDALGDDLLSDSSTDATQDTVDTPSNSDDLDLLAEPTAGSENTSSENVSKNTDASEKSSSGAGDSSSDEKLTHSSAELTPSGVLPASASVSFRVVNVSQDNQDATTVGARPGDVLRYELKITSDSEDIREYKASIDVSKVLSALDFTDIGLGVLENGTITYPAYTASAPCQQAFTFFAQLKPGCGDLKHLTVSSEGKTLTVGTSCQLARSGPSGQQMFLAFGIIVLMIGLVFGLSLRGKTSS